MKSDTKNITWDEIKDAAEQVFDLWVGHPELNWAKQAWGILTKRGLTTYSNEVERSEKLVYFLALTGIYRDFWCIAAGECVEIDYKDLADSLGMGVAALNKKQLLEYIKLIEENPETEERDDYDFFSSCYQGIANKARQQVYDELLKGFGNDESALFVSLWRSSKDINSRPFKIKEQNDEDDYDKVSEDSYETDEYILNTLTPEKEATYLWITEGCYPYQ